MSSERRIKQKKPKIEQKTVTKKKTLIGLCYLYMRSNAKHVIDILESHVAVDEWYVNTIFIF